MKGLVSKGVLVLAVVGALIGVLALGRRPQGPALVSGEIETDEIHVGSRVGGRVRAVHVREGVAVSASQVLVSLEPFDLEERVAEARAQLGAARAKLQELRAGSRPEQVAQARSDRDEVAARLAELEAGARTQELESAKAGLELAEAERRLAALEQQRLGDLQARGAASREQLDAAQTRLRVAGAQVKTRQAELALLREGSRKETIAQARARLARAQAALALVEAGPRAEEVARASWEAHAAEARVAALERARAELEIRSPGPALVDALSLQPGDLVSPNAPVMTLRDSSRLWIRAYVPAPYLARVSPDAVLRVRVDGFEGRTFPARVSFVSSQAEFTPRNAQTPEDRQLQVFRVRLILDAEGAPLRSGMGVDVLLGERE